MLAVVIFNSNTGSDFREQRIKRNNRIFVIFAGLCLFFVIGCRASSVGLDTSTYHWYFMLLNRKASYATELGWEPIYLLINEIGAWMDSYQVVLLVCAGVTVIGFCYFAYKNTDEKTSVFWYFFFYITLNLYFNSMHLIRQMCAVAIGINVYTVFKKGVSVKTFIKAAILLLLGAGFHISALLCIVLILPFLVKNVSKKTILWIAGIALLGIAFLSVGQEILIKLIPRFAKYINDDRLSEGHAGVFSVVMIAIKIFMIIFSLKLDPKSPDNKEIYRLTFVNVIGAALYILQFRTQFALRLGYYFEAFMPLYIPVFIKKMRGHSNRKTAYILMFLFGLSYFIYMMAFGGVKSNRGCVPYLFFWQ